MPHNVTCDLLFHIGALLGPQSSSHFSNHHFHKCKKFSCNNRYFYVVVIWSSVCHSTIDNISTNKTEFSVTLLKHIKALHIWKIIPYPTIFKSIMSWNLVNNSKHFCLINFVAIEFLQFSTLFLTAKSLSITDYFKYLYYNQIGINAVFFLEICEYFYILYMS